MEESLSMRKSITHIQGDLFLFKIVGDNLNVHTLGNIVIKFTILKNTNSIHIVIFIYI